MTTNENNEYTLVLIRDIKIALRKSMSLKFKGYEHERQPGIVVGVYEPSAVVTKPYKQPLLLFNIVCDKIMTKGVKSRHYTVNVFKVDDPTMLFTAKFNTDYEYEIAKAGLNDWNS